MRRWCWCLALLFLVDRNIRIDLPQSTFANLASLLECFTADQIMPDTTLPARSTCPILEERVHLLHCIIYLLQIHDSCGRLGEGLVNQHDIGLSWLFELLFCVLGFGLLR